MRWDTISRNSLMFSTMPSIVYAQLPWDALFCKNREMTPDTHPQQKQKDTFLIQTSKFITGTIYYFNVMWWKADDNNHEGCHKYEGKLDHSEHFYIDKEKYERNIRYAILMEGFWLVWSSKTCIRLWLPIELTKFFWELDHSECIITYVKNVINK